MTDKKAESAPLRSVGDAVFTAPPLKGQTKSAVAAPARRAGGAVKSDPKPQPLAGQGGGNGPGRIVARRPGPPRRPLGQTRARFRFRHWLLVVSFVLFVVAPSAFVNWYLHFRAVDQYASQLAFTIQSDDGPTLSTLGAIFGGSSGAVADDAEVLYGYIQSQNLVEKLQDELDLRTIYNRPQATDWWYSLGDDPSIEALTEYWKSMVLVSFDAGIVEVEVRAFDPQDAQTIAKAVLKESTLLINRLSAEAREDALRDARVYLEEAVDHLRDVRLRLTELRASEQRVDPSLDVQALMQRIGELEAKLTTEQLKFDQLRQFADESDSRVVSAERRIRSLEAAISEERAKLASNGAGETLSEAVGKFEELTVDRELAEQAYAVALASFENAKGEARRQQRYLSAHVAPTLAQTAEYPERYMLGGLSFVFLFMGWVVLVMIAYNIKDRR
ncbi:sugar transporter [Pikeienuella piscinae]|uniref:Sugar transporter n=1 Tax=Pikeienuella piscinae TaxID=2748098 RepID=A0A7L5C0Z0_9RHOB|nr:sugar transporter [Pikeienuella piscinae]QIE55814.1 sugar transporter [Pikeienuella piscinae]